MGGTPWRGFNTARMHQDAAPCGQEVLGVLSFGEGSKFFEGPHQELTFLHLDALMQAFFGVTSFDGHRGLGDNRAGINPGIHEMNRQPSDFNAVGERIPHTVRPGE